MLVQVVLLTSIVAAGIFNGGDWPFLQSSPLSLGLNILVLLLLVIGLVFLVSGLLCLGRFFTAFPEPLLETELVQSGVFAVVRHPLYTSVVFCALSWSLWWNSVLALILWACAVVFIDAKARHEEVRLLKKFDNYADYALKVKRLIPWVY